ncbi:MAG: hypothetical protein A3G32_07570 [Deltaproteobacteria bacterium RIFCSPLOWO2_12_FULL_40_28]|nr:MAG: hypothetical protein A3C45_03360 [Deltaproteobacteria bacterium RIFCSPHIGHO2_02_FULL_40_28]OGQ20275.1 MAG: hypothetical protein A3E27_06465 [Deltaproteobacteria bacterium RIFCSPHIGHO2_12_FULL_40_32]OGQ40386.1 MAG: hypothetical protein A3I69_06975 [Deltaproteobacteria bacterium RIFCSPLOWO2_02_FULL_40_36]OGQ54855.1 MAG: hypothetical protein A3G32_07570 [Deltaproteobacteria bacterium RIFCSPLOWO2_12_FULL_40_28]
MKKLILFLIPLVFLSYSLDAKENYRRVQKKLTRSDQVYRLKDLNAVILWSATYLSDELLNSEAGWIAKHYNLSQTEKADKLGELNAQKDEMGYFFVSFFSDQKKFSDLANPRDGWDLRLETAGERHKPVRIQKVKKPSPLEMKLYPYINSWSENYYVWFPINPSTPFQLAVYGPKGKSHLLWK